MAIATNAAMSLGRSMSDLNGCGRVRRNGIAGVSRGSQGFGRAI
jgi:hypothetical protein